MGVAAFMPAAFCATSVFFASNCNSSGLVSSSTECAGLCHVLRSGVSLAGLQTGHVPGAYRSRSSLDSPYSTSSASTTNSSQTPGCCAQHPLYYPVFTFSRARRYNSEAPQSIYHLRLWHPFDMASYDVEKEHAPVDQLQQPLSEIPNSDSDALNDACIHRFTPAEQRKIIRRIDRRLVLTLGFTYSVCVMDRNNLGFTVIAGMGVDLNLTGSRYSIIVLVFFITYVALQPLATVVLRKIGPRIFLPTITLLWGATMISFGAVKKWTDLVPLRLILGSFEAGFFPSCAYLLSCWYPRYELQKRNAAFYVIGCTTSAFSGILAYGFLQMRGLGSGAGLGQHYGPTAADPTAPSGEEGGIAGWRWIL
jgi:hypothetical protein